MVSSRKARANRANAQRSTGPRTVAGKQQSRRNALKHGLAVPVSAIAALSEETAALTQVILGEDRDPQTVEAAMRVAEPVIDVLRVRSAKADLLTRIAVAAKDGQSARLEGRWGWDQLDRLDRYERGALSRRRTALRALDEVRAAHARSGEIH